MGKENFFLLINYFPHAKQKLIHDSPARFRIVAAGARSGKSMAAGAEIAWELMKPDARIWVVGPQYDLSDKEFDWALTFLQRIEKGELLAQCRVSSSARGSRSIVTPWGSWVKTKSTEKPTSLLGEELDFLVLSEASQIARVPWERMLRARIGPRNGKLLAPSTPNADSGLFKEFFENGQSDDPNMNDWESWQFSTLDNPTFSRNEWEIAKGELDENIFREQYLGEFVSRRGKVFQLVNTHIFRDFPKDFESWPVIRGYQAGFQNPATCLFVALAPNRDYWVFQEVHRSQTGIEDMAQEVKEKSAGKRILTTLVDFRDTNTKDRLARLGIPATSNQEKKYSAKVATMRRIQCIQNCMKIRVDGTSRVHIHGSCENLIREVNECKWPEKYEEEAEKAEPELPSTKYLSSPLALSYILAFLETSRGADIYRVQAQQPKEGKRKNDNNTTR